MYRSIRCEDIINSHFADCVAKRGGSSEPPRTPPRYGPGTLGDRSRTRNSVRMSILPNGRTALGTRDTR